MIDYDSSDALSAIVHSTAAAPKRTNIQVSTLFDTHCHILVYRCATHAGVDRVYSSPSDALIVESGCTPEENRSILWHMCSWWNFFPKQCARMKKFVTTAKFSRACGQKPVRQWQRRRRRSLPANAARSRWLSALTSKSALSKVITNRCWIDHFINFYKLSSFIN